MLASVATFALEGVASREVTVEVDVRRGLPTFTLVGLPDRAVREARERVRAALLNSGLDFPLKRLTVNLAPAHLRKTGPGFDLAIAVALLAASGQIPEESLAGCAVCGELSLGGALRPGRGALGAALGARSSGYARLIVPAENAPEACLVEGVEVLPVPDLAGIAALFRGTWLPAVATAEVPPPATAACPDLADVRGQEDARRALEIAAAGGHNLLMVGPPGAGKTMLARRLPGILPPPSFDEALEITLVRSAAGIARGLARERPFRAPHHTVSPQGLVGGGNVPRPGEVTLAHRGVLFLDEMTEFAGPALDALRQPLEEGKVEITRGQRSLEFPAKVMLVAACNPCPCGRPAEDCECESRALARYARKLSGPLLDRIDLICVVRPLEPAELLAEGPTGPSSETVRRRVVAARRLQEARLAGTGAYCNGEMSGSLARSLVALSDCAGEALASGGHLGLLSGRGYDRVLKVARTIADLEGRDRVERDDVEEALGYRLSAGAALVA